MKETPAKIGRRAVVAGLAVLGGCGWAETETAVDVPKNVEVDRGARIVPLTTEFRFDLAMLEQHFSDQAGAFYASSARAWVIKVPPEFVGTLSTSSDYTIAQATETGYLALFQKCPHLGCRVPECKTSGLFECPCHGSKFTRFGEYVSGPSPRGLDRFASWIDQDELVIDTSTIVPGLPQGARPSGEDPLGPTCTVDAPSD